ncbi:hypothetical protein M422DRAFT_250646 [Sphaerobolus stellatus SS14]|uniref:DUF6533 domain-containing protein n=1 Tax=Sphaerobolus stellatus (strain SS14) TaxID=990650 RepID=A0A0C9USP6_SPHS4|nr:hypothetical protein M422DRAFT_250646 [Sphaerobolus stellatus SS14]
MNNANDNVGESERFVIHLYIQVALVAVYLYDYIICLQDEIDLMWLTLPWRTSTILYFATRYLAFAKLLFVLAVSHKAPPQVPSKRLSMFRFYSCTPIYRFVEMLGIVGRAAIVATLIGRTYAICDRKRLILLLPGVLGLAAVILGAKFYILGAYLVLLRFQFPLAVCIFVYETWSWLSENTGAVVIGATRIGLEATVIALLLLKSLADFKVYISVRRLHRKGLSSFILRTGIMYFFATLCLEILALLFNLKTSVIPAWLKGVTNALPLPIPAILISRLLLDLRRLAITGGLQSNPTSVVDSSLPFSEFHATVLTEFGDMSDLGTEETHESDLELDELGPHERYIPLIITAGNCVHTSDAVSPDHKSWMKGTRTDREVV